MDSGHELPTDILTNLTIEDEGSKENRNDFGFDKSVIGMESSESKREGYLEWDEFFMGTALLAAQRSKDPATQVGCTIVDEKNVIIAIGYNGFPRGCSDNMLPWGKSNVDPLLNKYFYVCHAEVNAILNCNSTRPEGKTLYTTLFPCNECAKSIIQAGIKSVIYLDDKPDKPSTIASKILFNMAKVETRKFESKRNEIHLKFI